MRNRSGSHALVVLIALLLLVIALWLVVRPQNTCQLTVHTTNPSGSSASGVDVVAKQDGREVGRSRTNVLGDATLRYLPCGQVAIRYGGGDWVPSDPQIIVLSSDTPVRLDRTVYACIVSPPCQRI